MRGRIVATVIGLALMGAVVGCGDDAGKGPKETAEAGETKGPSWFKNPDLGGGGKAGKAGETPDEGEPGEGNGDTPSAPATWQGKAVTAMSAAELGNAIAAQQKSQVALWKGMVDEASINAAAPKWKDMLEAQVPLSEEWGKRLEDRAVAPTLMPQIAALTQGLQELSVEMNRVHSDPVLQKHFMNAMMSAKRKPK